MSIKIMLASVLMVTGLATGAYLTFWTEEAGAQTHGPDCGALALRFIEVNEVLLERLAPISVTRAETPNRCIGQTDMVTVTTWVWHDGSLAFRYAFDNGDLGLIRNGAMHLRFGENREMRIYKGAFIK